MTGSLSTFAEQDEALSVEPGPAGSAALSQSALAQRTELARRLVDVLALPVGQMNDNERAFAADILLELIDKASEPLRIEISRRLASVMMPPPTLLRRLMLDTPEVATPLIDAFSTIPEAFLVEAAARGPRHREAIARKPRLTEFVVDALLGSDDTEMAAQLLRRPDITLLEGRIDQLVTRTIEEPMLREPLLGRIELQPRHGFHMFWWLDRSGRRHVISRFAIDRSVIQAALKSLFVEVFPDPDPDVVTKQVLMLCDRRHRPRGRNGETLSMDMVERMLLAARANPVPDLCIGAGLVAGVTPQTAERVLQDRGGEPFAVLAKSAGCSRTQFAEIMEKATLLRTSESHGPTFDEEHAEYLVRVFDMMARDYARTVLRYWDWRRDTIGHVSPGG